MREKLREDMSEDEEQTIVWLIRAAVRSAAYPEKSKGRSAAVSNVRRYGEDLIRFGYTGGYKIEPETETFGECVPVVPTPGTIDGAVAERPSRFGNVREEASIVPDPVVRVGTIESSLATSLAQTQNGNDRTEQDLTMSAETPRACLADSTRLEPRI